MKNAGNPVKILITDDHPIFHDAIKTLLQDENGFQEIGAASNGNETLKLLAKQQPDILLLDLTMPEMSGMEVLQKISDVQCKVKVIVLCEIENPEDIVKIFKLGARGFVLKESASYVLIKSIRAVMAGKYWVDHEAVFNPEKKLAKYKKPKEKPVRDNYGLTPREMDVIRTVVSGHSNKEIARKLGISEQTVKHHITNIFDKLGVFNRLELTLFVFHHGLVES